MLRPTTACTFSTSQLPKAVRTWCVLYMTWKCASRHNGVHFFNISTSKSGLRMVCFVHFDLEMCFAPQWRALFQHLNFQIFSFFTCKCASRHSGVQLSSLIWPQGSAPAALASLLFDPPEPQIIGKKRCFATFLPYLFAHLDLLLLNFSSSIFFLLLFSSLTLPISAFHLSILSEDVGSLTSKLPSIMGSLFGGIEPTQI